MTKTSIEIFVERLNGMIDFIPISKWDEIKNLIEQAKEIEKQQMNNAYFEGRQNWDSEQTFEEYYNQTFNK